MFSTLFVFIFAITGLQGAILKRNIIERIVGGEEAMDGQFSFAVSLRTSIDSHTCGGSIIHERWILTARHCIVGKQPTDLTVVVGTNSLSSGGVRYVISKLIPHEDYNCDIGMIKLADPITYGNKVKPIRLETEDFSEADVVLCGWGRTSYPGEKPERMQFLQLKTIPLDVCGTLISSTNVNEICTLTKEGEGACHGDSGGPLVHNNKVSGIVSRGIPCATGIPDIFTKVSAYVDWISNNIEKE